MHTRFLSMGALALATFGAYPATALAQTEEPITIVINQSPWLPGFQAVVELYEKTSGNTVDLDVNPFAGSLEKQRTAVRADASPFDLLIMNAGFFTEFYTGGFIKPLKEISDSFELSEDIYTFDDSVCWNADARTITCDGGELLAVPVNPNVLILHYRRDLYEEHGLEVPTTWEQLYENAKVLKTDSRYGISQRGQRGAFDVTYDVFPYIWSHGGGIVDQLEDGSFQISMNAPGTKAGMETYIRLANEVGHPSTAGQTQTNVIQNMATGRAAHINSVPAPGLFDDKNQSAVVGQVDYAPPPGTAEIPSVTPLGHWLAGIPRNTSPEKQKAALAFLTWFQTDEAQRAYAEAGSMPVSRAVLVSEMADQEEYRWMKAMAEALPNSRLTFTFPEASQVLAITELRFNQAIGGELELSEALNTAADEIAVVLEGAGYSFVKPDPLP
ncbi:extracellular solute-binding protein [Roseibium aggregatum]|uniref:extracellular solute-binding protein n=1 Tax=Roseibium aggregatum TaxID=187304 RepID=UPI0025ACDB68|nr:extracellular solute-binding protein [Roseibium aggregatum]WJS05639.1 extracellular solute-binding protein [Roseibium aggregatum]